MRSRDDIRERHLRNLAEPDHLRALRLQKERIENERERDIQRQLDDLHAEQLRKEIRALGEEPCA